MDYSDWFSRPKRMGEFGSSVHRSGGSICSGVGGETRCSAVWSAHLFWVQRAIGSNPVTLMWWAEVRSPTGLWRQAKKYAHFLYLSMTRNSRILSKILSLVRALGAFVAISVGSEGPKWIFVLLLCLTVVYRIILSRKGSSRLFLVFLSILIYLCIILFAQLLRFYLYEFFSELLSLSLLSGFIFCVAGKEVSTYSGPSGASSSPSWKEDSFEIGVLLCWSLGPWLIIWP